MAAFIERADAGAEADAEADAEAEAGAAADLGADAQVNTVALADLARAAGVAKLRATCCGCPCCGAIQSCPLRRHARAAPRTAHKKKKAGLRAAKLEHARFAAAGADADADADAGADADALEDAGGAASE
jgi:hypothetical protein